MVEPDPERAAAGRSVAQLERQAAALRAELVRLRAELAQVQHEFAGQRGALMLAANEQLVLAAMRAQAAAQDAESQFDALNVISHHDVLTGLPNRALMLDRLQTALALARRQGTRAAVLFVDLDHFKPINDRLGHAVGDEVLQAAAERLRSALRDSDTVSRFGGDEFVVLLADVSQPADAAHIAAKMLLALAADGQVNGHALTLSASIGIALYPEDGDDADTLIARSDTAMYGAKRQGGAGYRFAHDIEAARPEALPEPRPRVDTAAAAHATHLREANERLVLAAIRADERHEHAAQAQRRRVRFLAMLAHELRNALRPIGAALELLGRTAPDGARPPLRLELLVERQAALLARLADDLRDVARASTATFELRAGRIALTDVLCAAVDTWTASTTTRQQRVALQLPPDALPVRGDAQRLAQVFATLLDNASKHTPTGGRLTVSAAPHVGGHTVRIVDTGAGMTADALPGIVALFVRGARDDRVDAGGPGIGLAVVGELVVGHGGNVTATSAGPGRGSEFTVWLPMEPGAVEPR